MFSNLKKCKNTINKKTWLFTATYFFVSFLFFLAIHINIDGFFGSDPFYHAAHSSYYQDTFYYTQDWIKLHFFSSNPIDPYFLFHKGGGIFISWLGRELGFKVFGSLLAAITISGFYVLLKLLNIKRSHIWVLLFLLASPLFLIRLFLIRSFILAVLLILTSYYLIKQKKWLLLVIISSLYTLYYTLGVFVLIIATAFFFSSFIKKEKNLNWKPIFYSTIGVAIGVILHPDSINYLHQIYVHVIQIFYLKLTGTKLPTGNEINLSGFLSLLKRNYISILISVIATAGFFEGYNKQKLKKFLPLFLITAFWFLLMLFIPRAVEYWHPFSVLFAAIIFSNIKIPQEAIVNKIEQKIKWSKSNLIKPLCYGIIIVLFLLNGYMAINQILTQNKDKILQKYKKTAKYLKETSKKEELVYFTNWSHFPKFFYYNQKNKYITGFDPVFAYNYNKKKYWLWLNLSNYALPCDKEKLCYKKNMKNYPKNLKSAFSNLEVNYLVLENKNDKFLLNALNASNSFEKINENDRFTIFKINS